jgi:hypothetical protein
MILAFLIIVSVGGILYLLAVGVALWLDRDVDE